MESFKVMMLILLVMVQLLPSAKPANQTLTLAYLIPWSSGWEVGPFMGSAFVVGLETVKKRQILPGYEIKWTWRDTQCESLLGIKMAVDMWSEEKDLDGIIGDGCSTICEPLSLLASAWGIPVVSYGCVSPLLSDKSFHPTFSRTIGPWAVLAPMFNALADKFGWNRVGVITDSADLMRTTAEAAKKEMESAGKKVFFYTIEPTMVGNDINPVAYAKQQQIVRSMKNLVRVLFIFTFGNDVRNILITAYDEGMLVPGYSYICMDVAFMLYTNHTFRPELGNLLFEGVLMGTPLKPGGQQWDDFARNVIDRFDHPAFEDMQHLPPTAHPSEVEVHAGLVHDAILQWAYGVNMTLTQGYRPDNGFKVTENIFNMKFTGISGQVAIDYKGDRKTNYKLDIVQNGTLLSMFRWDAANDKMHKEYKPASPDDWSGIIWPGGSKSIPSDSPECGWQGELCAERERDELLIKVLVTVLTISLLLTILAAVLWRIRSKQALKEALACCIPYKEVEIFNSNSGNQSSLLDNDSLQHVQCNNHVRLTAKLLGHVRNELVVIHNICGTSPNLTDKQVLKDLKNMKEIKHENLNNFIGICLEHNNTYTLMSYASRGSLKNTLQETTQMSMDFKLSLLNDIAQGLNYLHSSEIEVHGHLTSLNCVVDKRWTCKITDYGLRYIRSLSNSNHETPLDAYELLWTAPEQLRNPCISQTQPGDIYSFAIITQEVLLQDEPYAYNWPQISSTEIIEELKVPTASFFRPVIPPGSCNDDWTSLMESCWTELPQQRPTTKRVISLLRKLNGGQSLSLVDNMVQRLEGYTKNLEDLVTDRSQDIQEEKNKMEHLLKELLPASVAEQLKSGKPVLPETFDEVTILFSDIVSFTRICAAGTPNDVVYMLNSVYTIFDDVCSKWDVFKVATIGDAYLLASGVPVRNGDRHASEICHLSLDLLNTAKTVTIPHLPHENLKLRFGIHSGPCAAGVAGSKAPRYLLFGETVDLTSRIESNGESMKVHISSKTADNIKDNHAFHLISRGEIYIKGLGYTETFWLEENVISCLEYEEL